VIAAIVSGSVRVLAAARSNVEVESRVIEWKAVGFVIAVSTPFAAIVFAIEPVSERVLAAEHVIEQDAVAAGVGEIRVGAILLVES